MRSGRATRLRTVAAALVAALLAACVTRQRDEVAAAREAHRHCVAAHSKSYPDCEVLEARLQTLERQYETSARRAWACDPAQPDCPTPR